MDPSNQIDPREGTETFSLVITFQDMDRRLPIRSTRERVLKRATLEVKALDITSSNQIDPREGTETLVRIVVQHHIARFQSDRPARGY